MTSDRNLRSLRPASELAAGRPHGDRLRYVGGCRCDLCRRANTEYERGRAAARKAGLWNGIVDASAARAHLIALAEAGVGRRPAADASGIGEGIVFEIRNGTRRRIRAATERAILAVTPAAAADRAPIDAAPTWALLDDLLALGYSKAQLARELGYQREALQIRRDRCTVRNAYEVQRLHERLRRVAAGPTLRLLEQLREEGYRPGQITAMATVLAQRQGQPAPDLDVYGGFVSARAADLVRRLHADITEVPDEPAAGARAADLAEA